MYKVIREKNLNIIQILRFDSQTSAILCAESLAIDNVDEQIFINFDREHESQTLYINPSGISSIGKSW